MEQQYLNENQHEAVEPRPIIQTTEIMTDSMNTQQILHEEQVQVVEETQTTVEEDEEELLDVRLTRSKQYDSEPLARRLQLDMELTAKAKAKEEVTVCTLQSHLQELQVTKLQLDEDTSALLHGLKEKYQQDLQVELSNCYQLEYQMQNTGNLADAANNNYKKLKETYQTALAEMNILEQECENNLEAYEVKKGNFLNTIKVVDKNLEDIKSVLDANNKQYNRDFNKKNSALQQLKEADIEITNAIANMTKMCNDLKNKLDEDNKILQDTQCKNQALKNSIDNINLDKLEEQKIEKQESYQKILRTLAVDITNTRDSFEAAEKRKLDLLLSLENEDKNGNEVGKASDELEIEHNTLLMRQKELDKNDKIIDDKANIICSIELKVETICSKLSELKEEITGVVQNKTKMIQNLCDIQKSNAVLQMRLADFHNNATELTESYELNKIKLPNLEENVSYSKMELKNASSQVLDAKEKYLNNEKASDAQMEKVDVEFAEAQKNQEHVNQGCNMKLNTAKGNLLTYIGTTERVLKENAQKTNKTLQDIQEQWNENNNQYTTEKEKLEQTKFQIKQQELQYEKYKLELKLAKYTASQEYLEIHQAPDNIKPPSILKSPGSLPIPKTVSWRVPSNSSYGSDMSQLDCRTTDDLFNELLMGRSRPAQRLENLTPTTPTTPKKRRFD